MNLSFPISPEQIRAGMGEVVTKIQEETGWNLERNLSDISITMGDASEFGSDFGTVRASDSIIFGSWVNQIVPETVSVNLFEFLIIRESISLFFEEKYLFSVLKEITDFFLNLMAISFLRKEYDKRALEIRLSNATSRFLFIAKEVTSEERLIFNKKHELLTLVISQTISIRLLRDTYFHFIEDTPFEEIDIEELLDYVLRYLSNSPEEVISPIRLNRRTLQVLEELVNLGFSGTTPQIAENLGINTASISRILNQIAVRYNAKFRVEKNYYKLGLHYHLIIIRLEIDNQESYSRIMVELEKIKYIYEIYSGLGNDYQYIYCVTLCPFIVAENLSSKLQRYQNSNIIISFDVKPTQNRIFQTALIDNEFSPTFNNYKKLISGEIPCKKLVTWDNSYFEEDISTQFSERDSNLLRFLSIYQSNGIVNYNYYKVFQAELKELLNDNELNTRNMQDCLTFMNRIRVSLLDQNLIDFRLQLTLTSMAVNEYLILKISCDPDEKKIHSLIERLSVFSWTVIHIGYEDIVFSIHGLNYSHPISKLVIKEIEDNGFKCEYFSVTSKVWRSVPFDTLYSYQDNRWFLE